MIQALAERDKYGRIVLLYGARTPDDLLYVRELEQWRSRLDLEILVTVDRALGAWRGNVGVVTTLFPRASYDPFHALALVCGPEVMMRFAIMELQKRGTPPEEIFLSMERNMKCGIGLCGHCQIGPTFVCKEGPVYRYDRVKDLFGKREL
jgi:NAD(P)H-flavin reductase